MAVAVKGHYMKKNHNHTVPKRLFIVKLGIEIYDPTYEFANADLHQWSANYIQIDYNKGTTKITPYTGNTKRELLDTIDDLKRTTSSLWIMVEEPADFLILTNFVDEMKVRGYNVTRDFFFINNPFGRMADDRKRITLSDIKSILSSDSRKYALNAGLKLIEKPRDLKDDAGYLAYLQNQVDIYSHALVNYLFYWDQEQLGNFSQTGPGCGMHAYRHKFMDHKILITHDINVKHFERKAIYSGRREAFYHGPIRETRWIDFDFKQAYLSIARHHELPTKLVWAFDSLSLDDILFKSDNYSIIAEVELKTSQPVYPQPLKTYVVHGHGHFKTVLAGPEIEEARRRGELVSIGKGYAYQMDDTMSNWADWINGILDGREETPAVMKAIAKSWSRTVFGKWASTSMHLLERNCKRGPMYVRTIENSTEPIVENEDVYTSYPDYDGPLIAPGSYTCTDRRNDDGTYDRYIHDIEVENSFPAVLAFVQSYLRVYLRKLHEAIGDSVVQMDTDGVLVDSYRWLSIKHPEILSRNTRKREIEQIIHREQTRINQIIHPMEIVIKHNVVGDGFIWGAQMYLYGNVKKLSGIPSGFTEQKEKGIRHTGVFKGMVKRRFTDRVNFKDFTTALMLDRQIKANPRTLMKWKLTNGDVMPLEFEINEQGQNELVIPWVRDPFLDVDYCPLDEQHTHLEQYVKKKGVGPPSG